MELVIDPHYVPLARISELGNEAQLPAYRTLVRSLEPESVTQNRLQLEDLFSAFGKQWDEGTKNGPDRSALLGHNFVYQETKPHGFYSSYFHQRISS